jgi:hypothetical protein
MYHTWSTPVLTLEQTLADQENLDRLCADRPLQTSEIFKPNGYYGIDAVFKRYAGLPRTYALKAVVPHGVHVGSQFVWDRERDAPVPVVFCYPSFRQYSYMKQTTKVIIPSASPFLYVADLLQDQPQPERQGTIFFPVHSIKNVHVQMNFDLMAEQLSELNAEYQPVTVCIYWQDYLLGYHLPFQQRGLRTVSAGHRYDPDFLFRLFHLCSLHRYAAGNRIGSHLFLSVVAGCSFFLFLDDMDFSFLGTVPQAKKNFGQGSPEMFNALHSLFKVSHSMTSVQQQDTVNHYMGTESLQSRRGLRRQLLAAEVLDNLGFSTHRHPRRCHMTFPHVAYRSYTAAKRRIRSQLRRCKNLYEKSDIKFKSG